MHVGNNLFSRLKLHTICDYTIFIYLFYFISVHLFMSNMITIIITWYRNWTSISILVDTYDNFNNKDSMISTFNSICGSHIVDFRLRRPELWQSLYVASYDSDNCVTTAKRGVNTIQAAEMNVPCYVKTRSQNTYACMTWVPYTHRTKGFRSNTGFKNTERDGCVERETPWKTEEKLASPCWQKRVALPKFWRVNKKGKIISQICSVR